MNWPNTLTWSAGKHEHRIVTENGDRFTTVVPCGSVFLPSGRLVVCDPFVFLERANNPYTPVPRGRFPVTITLADVSKSLDGSHIREAYASVLFSDRPEAYRRSLPLVRDGEDRNRPLQDEEFIGFAVDTGTACFIDGSVIANCLPSDPSEWHTELFENESPDCWFNRMDDPNHIRNGLANIQLPNARDGENIILIHSGWGDEVYPVVGSFTGDDQLIAAHIDFGVV